jgi:hypothetical protein
MLTPMDHRRLARSAALALALLALAAPPASAWPDMALRGARHTHPGQLALAGAGALGASVVCLASFLLSRRRPAAATSR